MYRHHLNIQNDYQLLNINPNKLLTKFGFIVLRYFYVLNY